MEQAEDGGEVVGIVEVDGDVAIFLDEVRTLVGLS